MAYQSVEIARLQAQQEALDKQLAAAKDKETQHAMREIVQKMREYGITLNELMGRKSGEQRPEPAAKYQDPLSSATWSGRGRAPHWIVGKDRDDYLIDKRGTSRAVSEAGLFSEER
jgi:DNA-binding protein H-NS